MRKIISIILILLILISQTAFAENITEHILSLNKVECVNAAYNGDSFVFLGEGSIRGECNFPFSVAKLRLKYNALINDVSILFEFDGDVKSSVQTILKKDSSYTEIILPKTERSGIRNIKAMAQESIQIEEIVLIKENLNYGWGGWVNVDFSADEVLLQTATVISMDSPIAIVRNAKRYVNPNNYRHMPAVHNGIAYMPVDFFMEMLNVYCEKDEENCTAVVKNDNIKMSFDSNGCIIEENGVTRQAPLEIAKYYCTLGLPLRYIAETFNKTVDYKDGLIIIDEPYRINNILNNEKLIKKLREDTNVQPFTGQVLHVSQKHPNANDTNSGSESMPFKTINGATAVAKAGDKILVHDGVYRETVRFQNNGKLGAPIILEGAASEDVTISANEKIEKFVKYKDNIYLASISAPLADNKNLVFYNGEALAEARHPNIKTNDNRSDLSWLNLSPLWGVQGDISAKNPEKPYELTSEKSLNQSIENYWKGATFVGLVHEGWRRSMAKVASSENGKITLDTSTVSYGYWGSSTTVLDTDFGYLVGHMNALDIPGEWVIQNKVMYIIPPEGSNLASDVFEYKSRQLLIDLTGKSNIKIKNIKGIGGSVNMKDASLCMLDKCNFKYVSHFVWAADSRDGFIDNATDYSENGAQARGEVGIYVGGSDNVIMNCIIDKSAGAGLFTTGKYAYILNNEIVDCGYGGIFPGGIFITFEPWKKPETQRGGHAIYFNSVYNCSRSALNIQAHSPWIANDGKYTRYIPMDIAYNDFYNGGILGGRDGGIINSWCVSLGDDINRTKIHHNVVWDSYAYDNGHSLNVGIYYDDCTQMLDSYSNVTFYTNEEATLKLCYFNHQEKTDKSINIGLLNWNSAEHWYKPEGKAGLTKEDYPQGEFFKSGSSLNKLGGITPKESNTSMYYAKDAELSENMTIVRTSAVPAKSESYIKFENVDCGEMANSFEVYFTGNQYDEKAKIQIIVDDLNNLPYGQQSLQSEAPDYTGTSRGVIPVSKLSGVHDIYVKFVKISSVGIQSIRPYNDTTQLLTENMLLKCETFDDKGKWKDTKSTLCNALITGIKDTWGGNFVAYEGRRANQDYNKVTVVYATKPPYSGNIMNIYNGNMEGEPIATITLEGTDWNEKKEVTVDLQSVLKEGIHNIYIAFDGDAFSSNLYTVEFKSE